MSTTSMIHKPRLRLSEVAMSPSSETFTAGAPKDYTVDITDYPGGVVMGLRVMSPTVGAQYFNIVRYGGGRSFRVVSSQTQNATLYALIVTVE